MDETPRTMTGAEVNHALRLRRLRQADLAHATGIPQPTLSATLSGGMALTPERKAAIERGIADLRLAEEVPPTENTPIFSVPVESTSE